MRGDMAGGGGAVNLSKTQTAFDTGQQRDYSMLDSRIIRSKQNFITPFAIYSQ